MPFTQHSLGKTFYLKKGKNRKTPIVCLHGGPGGTHHTLRPLLEMGVERSVYLYDQFGSGKSSSSKKKNWNISSFVRELDELISALGIEKLHLFGASWGTTLALEYFLRKKGAKISSLIFQSPMFSAKDWERDAQVLISKLPKKTQKVINLCHEINATDSKVYESAVMEYYQKHVLRDKKKLLKLFKNNAGSSSQIYEYMWGPSEFKPTGTLAKYNKVNRLKEIDIPTLIICGQYDEARPETGLKYSKKIKNSRFVEIKKCSHIIALENKKELISNIKKFIEEVE